MKDLERQHKALANRRRLAILKYLKRNQQASVGDIAREIKLTLKATSKHLAILAAVDAVEKEQKGLRVMYRLSSVQKSIVKHTIHLL